jgi:hypothetical protein
MNMDLLTFAIVLSVVGLVGFWALLKNLRIL